MPAAPSTVMMPGLSGIQVLEQLKLVHPECEAIMLTGQGTIETAVQAMKLGAYGLPDQTVSAGRARSAY
ncbi:MAG: response regulator [Synechococcales cyanobacterium CRU_2_2]|nr:response regulator [Synechococcales cyanobacterium CRU_2_2]